MTWKITCLACERGEEHVTGDGCSDKTNPKDLIGSTKPSISKIPGTAIIECAQALQNGADKYGPYNWRETKVRQSIYIDAILRHVLALFDGEDVADDSKLAHEAHIMAGCAILIDARAQGTLIDDRPVKGHTSELIKKYSKEKK